MSRPRPLSVTLVGEMRVRRGDSAVELPQSKKTRGLLAYLLWSGRSHRRSQLASLLWCDVEDPRGGLRWSLSKVRTILDEDGHKRVHADRDRVNVNGSDVSVDALTLLRAARALEEAATEELASMMDGLQGELLEGLDLSECPDFHAWRVAAREEVRRAQLALLEELVGRLTTDPERAIGYARRWVQLDRDSDAAHLALLGLLRAAGRIREAEEHYRVHARWLADRGRRPTAALRHGWYEAVAVPAAGEPPADDGTPHGPVVSTRPPQEAPAQEIRFCTTRDGVRIAYAVSGEGPPLVKTTHWMSHLEYEWRSPLWRHWLQELARRRTLLRYDERGNGLSDWEVEDLSLEAFVHDLETVVEAAGFERFPLFGISQGCAVAVDYAVRHPDRVTHLVLVNGFARGWRVRGNPRVIESTEALVTLARHGWGRAHPAFRQTFTSMFFPEATAEEMREFDEVQRRTTSPDNAARLLESFGHMDVADRLSRVKAPTLVFHSRYDGLIPFSWGREMAAGIPGARFVPLESRNHLLLAHEPAWGRFVEEMRSFLKA